MLIEVKVPQLSESVAEATLVSWHKHVGDAVMRDENLIDIETDKVVLELPAPESGVLVEMPGELADGTTAPLIVHRDDLPLVEQAAAGALSPARTTFLSPFASLFWARERDEEFWNFRQRLEAYTPAAKRIWGYFCLAILHGDRLVGRFDPKLERKTNTLRLKALYLEPGIDPADELIAGVAGAMSDFLTFHKANNLVIERSDPAIFGEKLLAAV
jgi:uncharacterized protein YcaQ